MEKEEIIAAIKNALQRNQSLESAKQSLINAGYNRQDVSDSADALNFGIAGNNTAQMPEQKTQESSAEYQEQMQVPEQNAQEEPLSQYTGEPEKKHRIKPWMIISIILVLLIIGGILVFVFAGEKILDFFLS